MDSEGSAHACATQRHHRYMSFGKKLRYIEVFQCSGEDMRQVLTGGTLEAPATMKPMITPGTLPAQTPATLTHPVPQAAAHVAVANSQPPFWDFHAIFQAQAHAQAQAQAQALRNQDFWLMTLASNPPPTSTNPASPNATGTSKALALPGPPQHHLPQHPHHMPSYAMAAQQAAALHQQPTPAPFLLFNMPPRIPILRAPPQHNLLGPMVHNAPSHYPAALMGLKRTWDSAFPADVASVAPKRATAWQPNPAFGAPAPGAPPGLAYPAQFYPQI